MNSNVTLTNSSQFYLANAEVFLRSIPTQIKFGELSDDALRLLVYYISKAGPFELAVESGYFTGTLEEWLSSLKSNLQFKAVVDEYSDLATFEGASQGDLVFVKSTNMAYIYDGGAFAEEVKGISITGPSAYDSAVTNGFQGTVQDFLDSLKGEDGDDGLPGVNGSHGLSAYEIAQEAGFTGTEAEWLASLVGTPGQDGIDGDQGVPGINGRSAYELAVESGFEGNLEDWLASLVGLKGEDGVDGIDGVTQNATTITFTGLDTSDSSDVTETDTLLAVIGKLQAQLSALKLRVDSLEGTP